MSMNAAIIFTIGAFVFWGFWTFFAEQASSEYTTGQAYLIIALVNLIGAGLYAYFIDDGSFIPKTFVNVEYLLLTGLFSTLGAISFYEAIRQTTGNTGLVVTISALYFMFSAVLGWVILGNSLTLQEWSGIALAGLGVVLFTYQF